jgi:hypothetical protein
MIDLSSLTISCEWDSSHSIENADSATYGGLMVLMSAKRVEPHAALANDGVWLGVARVGRYGGNWPMRESICGDLGGGGLEELDTTERSRREAHRWPGRAARERVVPGRAAPGRMGRWALAPLGPVSPARPTLQITHSDCFFVRPASAHSSVPGGVSIAV